MKLRSMTGVQWMEFVFGALIPTVVWGWIAVLALAAAVSGFWGVSYGLSAKIAGLISVSVLLVPLIGGLACMWFLTLCGVGQLNERPLLRWFSIIVGIAALLLAAQFVIGSVKNPRHDSWVINISLVGPMIVGLKYLPQLIRGNP